MELATAFPLLQTDPAGLIELSFLSRCLDEEQRTLDEQIRVCMVMIELSEFLFRHRFDGIESRQPLTFIVKESQFKGKTKTVVVKETDCHHFYLLYQANELADMCIAKLTEELNLSPSSASIFSLHESQCVSAVHAVDRVIGMLRHCLVVMNTRCSWAKSLMVNTCDQLENRFAMLRVMGLWLSGGYVAAFHADTGSSADALQLAGNRIFTCQQLIESKLSHYPLAKAILADCKRLQALTSAQWNVSQANIGAAVAFFRQARSLGTYLSPATERLMAQNDRLGQTEPTESELGKTPPSFTEDKTAVTGSKFAPKGIFRLCERSSNNAVAVE
jgi:hypothetical protein